MLIAHSDSEYQMTILMCVLQFTELAVFDNQHFLMNYQGVDLLGCINHGIHNLCGQLQGHSQWSGHRWTAWFWPYQSLIYK